MIRFFEEGISYRLRHKRKTRLWIKSAIKSEGFTAGDMNYIFCSDTYLNELNVKHLNHDTYTDIISFDLSEDEEIIQGDIFISTDRARENSRKYKTSLQSEIRRLIIHGTLHLCGYHDKSAEEKQLMREREDYYLTLHP
jgi:rRNA maturation RNase YbeY